MLVLYQQSSSTDVAELKTLFFYPHHSLAAAEHHQCLIPAQPIIKIISICKKNDPSDSFQVDSQPVLHVEWTSLVSVFREHL